MMPTEMTSSAQQDESAVAAVWRGDAERYRELVERHERRVFAVAWSRLGDAALAEEAAQEAFIRGYRRLWLLGDGAKFAAWITTIARHAAINLGLRHRRELNKRERWALEQPAAASPATGESTELCPPETLRQTLAELPAAHRECLVLFYLEGKSGAEAAATLGISEAALRVRLHRARAALRERLEENLEGSLANLRPAKTLVSSVMAGVLASSSAKAVTAGGIGAAIFGTLAKFTPFKWLFTLFAFIPLILPVIMILPGLLFQRWQRRDEQRNYRDQKGFRASLHRQIDISYLVFFALLIGMTFVSVAAMTRPFGFGTKDLFLVIGLFALAVVGFAGRLLEINCSWFRIGFLFCNLVMSGFYLCIGLGWLPIAAVFQTIMISTLFTVFANPNRFRPLRMDNNLFLRATQDMLPPADFPVREKSSIRFDRAARRAFARFLGERQLASDFRWGTGGMTLYLPAVKSPLTTMWNRIFPTVRNSSSITLGWDGLVAAHCGKKDAAGLEALRDNSIYNLTQLENQVALAVGQAWQDFRDGRIAFAERAIGEISDTEIFVVPPGRTRANRWMRIVTGGFMAVASVLLAAGWLFPEKLSGLKPVSTTEAQVRAFLGGIKTNSNYNIISPDSPQIAMDFCLVLPPANLFSRDGLLATRQEVLRFGGFNPGGTLESKYASLGNSWTFGKAIAGGWFSLNDLGVDSGKMSAALHNQKIDSWMKLRFQLCQFQCSNDGTNYTVGQVNSMILGQLRLLRDVNCLDLVDREKNHPATFRVAGSFRRSLRGPSATAELARHARVVLHARLAGASRHLLRPCRAGNSCRSGQD